MAKVTYNTDETEERYRVIVKLHDNTLNQENVQIQYDYYAREMRVEHAGGQDIVIPIPVGYDFDSLKAHWVSENEYHAIIPHKTP